MKKFLLIAAVFATILTGCSKDKSASKSETDEVQIEVEESNVDENDAALSSLSSDEVSDDDSASSSDDWDEVLKSYEKFADRYIALLKKAQSGDPSAISEYSDYMEEAQSFADKLNSASGEMTPSQIARFQKIQQKIVNAASKMGSSNLGGAIPDLD